MEVLHEFHVKDSYSGQCDKVYENDDYSGSLRGWTWASYRVSGGIPSPFVLVNSSKMYVVFSGTTEDRKQMFVFHNVNW